MVVSGFSVLLLFCCSFRFKTFVGFLKAINDCNYKHYTDAKVAVVRVAVVDKLVNDFGFSINDNRYNESDLNPCYVYNDNTLICMIYFHDYLACYIYNSEMSTVVMSFNVEYNVFDVDVFADKLCCYVSDVL